MRSAEVSDAWRRLATREFLTTVDEAVVDKLRGISGVRVALGGGLIAFCGQNGAGKTSLLRALHLVLDSGDEATVAIGAAASEAQIKATVTVSKAVHNLVWPHTGDIGCQVEATWIDSGSYAPLLRRRIEEFGGVQDQLPGIEPRITPKTELDELQYVTGRYYSSIKTYEIDVGEEEPVPYFVCTSGGIEYGLEDMGQGELSAHLLLWALRRVAARSIVLLEEPETFLAPRSQSALLDLLARISEKRIITIVLSTHSEAMLRRLPLERVRLVTRTDAGVRVTPVATRATYLTALGVPTAPRCVVLVEDDVARTVARTLIGRYAFDALAELAFEVVRDGESGICELLKRWPGGSQPIIGLFDGDQRVAMEKRAKKEQFNCPYAFLPGDAAPEEMLRRATSKSPGSVAALLKISEDTMHQALSLVQGRDLHDWLRELTIHLNVEIDTLIRAMVTVWLEDVDTQNATMALVESLVQLVRADRKI